MKFLAAVAMVAACASPVFAQDSPAGGPAEAGRYGRTPDFLFHTPRATLGVRVSWLSPRAGSDLFTFVSQHLTVDRGDFQRPAIIAEGGFAITPRVDMLGGVEVSRSDVPSEYRDLVDNRRAAITQRTYFDLMNVSAGVKVGLLPKGRTVSRLAWVPRNFVPYVGGGAGVAWYKFKQVGDFVDFADLGVFTDVFSSKGWAPSAHVAGGADLRVWRILSLSMEARYVWSEADLGRDFTGFEPIDLSGVRLSTGVNVLF